MLNTNLTEMNETRQALLLPVLLLRGRCGCMA